MSSWLIHTNLLRYAKNERTHLARLFRPPSEEGLLRTASVLHNRQSCLVKKRIFLYNKRTTTTLPKCRPQSLDETQEHNRTPRAPTLALNCSLIGQLILGERIKETDKTGSFNLIPRVSLLYISVPRSGKKQRPYLRTRFRPRKQGNHIQATCHDRHEDGTRWSQFSTFRSCALLMQTVSGSAPT